MPAAGKLVREALACACLGYLAVALFHPGIRGSAGLVAGALAAAVLLAALLVARPRSSAPAGDVPEGPPPAR